MNWGQAAKIDVANRFSALEGLEISSVDDTWVKIGDSIKASAKEKVGILETNRIKPWFEESRLRVFENRILRRIFGPKRDDNGEWRRLHNEELHSLYRSPNIVSVIKSRRLRWAGHVARMEEGRSAFKI